MSLFFKTRLLNVFRRVFLIPCLEAFLKQLATGRASSHFICKLIPAHSLFPIPSGRLLRREGLELNLDISDYIDHALFFGVQCAEAQSYQRLLDLVEPHFNCIDVGTKNGYLSLRMAGLAPDGCTLGFEADPLNYRQSLDNLRLNSLRNVSIQNVGLGERKARGIMETRIKANRGGNRIAQGETNGPEVQIEKLDDVLRLENVVSVDLIKIDVEGYELKVLRGAADTLRKFKPILFVEVDDANLRDQGDSAVAMVEYLNVLGYHDLKHATTKLRITTTSNCLAGHFDLIAR